MAKKSKKTGKKTTTKKSNKKSTKAKGGKNPNMKKALKSADKLWPKAKEAPIVGFQLFPEGTFIGRLSGAKLKPSTNGAYVQFEHTVVKGELEGRKCSHARFLTGKDEESTERNLGYLAGEIEAHGFELPDSISDGLEEVLAEMEKDAPVVQFKVTHWGDNKDNMNVYILDVVDEDDLDDDDECADPGSDDDDADDESEDDVVDDDDQDDDDDDDSDSDDDSDDDSDSDDAEGDDDDDCFGTFEKGNEDCENCSDKKKCKAAQKENESDDDDDDAEGDDDDDDDSDSDDETPEPEELLALCKEWGVDVPKKVRKDADKLMQFISENVAFPESSLSEDEMNLIERFPEEYPVELQ